MLRFKSCISKNELAPFHSLLDSLVFELTDGDIGVKWIGSLELFLIFLGFMANPTLQMLENSMMNGFR